MFLGEFFKKYFLCKQFEPEQARHSNVRSRSVSTPCVDPNEGGGGSGGLLLKYHKNIVSLAIGPDP